jgi:amino acid adenylation domain-containing protein/non-ribosomal peptide synthase protein (TIGR01720 family)
MPRNSSLADILETRAAEQGERPAYVFLSYEAGGMVEEPLTYAELDARARAIGAALQAAGACGERVLLLFPPGPDFAASFSGCLYAGAIAVPAPPPRRRGGDPRLRAICHDARPRVVLASANQLPAIERAAAEIPDLSAALRMAPTTAGAPGWRRPELGEEALAFLQYTSGSTSSPKGVMVSHGNLLDNEERIRRAFAQSPESVVLGWLPLYHDMGLIGTMLQPLYSGAVSYLMPAGAFLQRPARWLEAISRYRATTSGGPNFAYDLCVRKVREEEKEGLDLSSWQVAFNGAEPVRAGTLRRFADTFAPCGFRSAAFRPCYGLAEATLLVSGGRDGGEPRVGAFAAEALARHEVASAGPEEAARSRELVSCGAAMQTVLAVDPESGNPCLPGRVGEIWVASPSVAQGYWERPQETAATFGASLADGAGPFLRTGDLGFVSEGEVFLTGRLKDLIILRGRNHYPQDLERTAEESHADLRPGGGAAFALEAGGEEGEERLVIVHEVARHAAAGLDAGRSEAIAAAVRAAVAEEHEVSVSEVVLIRPETLPRTSSGKVRRSACRELYLEDGLRVLGASRLSPAVADEAPRAEAGAPDWLRRAFAAAVRIDPGRVDPDLPLIAAGLDSLTAVELQQAIEETAGVSLPLSDLLEGMTLCELERRVAGGEARPKTQVFPAAGEAAGEHPLSWNQRSLWFLNRLAPEDSAYNLAGAARLGPIDQGALGRAIQALVDRHPMLRATFADTPGGPVQRIAQRAAVGFVAVDATGWSDAEVMARLQAEAFRPFDLAAGPLLRAVLLSRGDESFLVLAVHHIAADFWSLAVLAREFGALVAGEALPPPPGLYTDFARRQEQQLAGPEGERLWEHWRERLAGAPQLDLPTDRPRRPLPIRRGASQALLPSAARAEAVHRLAAAHGATPFMALLTAWQAVLSRWSGQEELLSGSPMAGRSTREWGEVVGYFVNLVPLCADLSGDPTVRDLLVRTRHTVLAAVTHQGLPFARLAELLEPERDASRPPLVAAMLTFEKAPAPELQALAAFAVGVPGVRLDVKGLVLESLPLAPPAAQLDLSLTAAELAGGLALSLVWDADLFDATTAGRLLDHLDRLIAGMAAAPDLPLAELPLLGEAERQQFLVEWNDTAAPAISAMGQSSGALLPDLFAAQVARTPDATAAVFQGEALTYAGLDARAERLAWHLRQLGCAAESRVGVALERSLDLIVALLGVLKAGAAYVPLDPGSPRERLSFLLADAAPQVLLTEMGRLPAFPAPIPAEAGDDRQLAYILYTSGSTGRPKGVGVSHRALVNFLASMRRTPGFFAGERLLAVTPATFDIAALEIFLPLTTGGTVELASREEAADGALLAARLRNSGAAVLQATPATWRMLVDAGWTGDPTLRALCGGEAMPRDLAASLAGRTGELWNLYGPTETTVWSAAARVRPGETGPESGPISIGRPIAETQIHLLDRHLRTIPLGAPGELWIGGAGLARGYLGRPDLTAERFLPNPFAAEPGERLYRTGDLARHLPGGRMEVLGRIDHQVKIRGFRIEPGEVEAALADLPGIREAVVAARQGPAGDLRLVAYVVVEDVLETALSLQALRERLPDFMVPAALVRLPALPLTPNGKVDRKALPEPEWPSGEEGRQAPRTPRTPIEEVLAGIWAEVLGLERVGAADHFFDLGGHSLLATRVMARLRGALGVEMPLRELFAAPRLADFALRVEAARRTGAAVPGAPAPPLVPVPRAGDLPLSFAQQRLWFLDQLEPGSPLYNMPGALRIEGPLSAAVLARCLGEIVRRHETLRTVFAAPAGSAVQVIRPAAPFPLPVVDLAGLPEHRREALALALLREEAGRPFDLTRDPILRGRLLRLAGEDHLVLLTLHHIAGDAWSLGLLAREIAALYPALLEGTAGRPSPLAELTVQYADFAIWQHSWLRGEVLEREVDWWRRQLAGLPPLLTLSTDRPRPAVQSYRGATRPVRLSPALTRQAGTLARRSGATLFMVLLAGFQALLARLSGQEDLAVGSSIAGRTHREVEPLIGCFVNTLVLRGDLAGDPTFIELLGRVRETALAAYLHQDAPFEKLVEELAPERSLAQSPLFQVMFELQNVPAGELEIEGLRLCPVSDASTVAKFDLTLTLEERDGGLLGTLEYATDLFDTPTVDLLIGQYERLLAAALAAPEERIGEPSLLSAAERHQLFAEWNDTAMVLPEETSLPGLFALQAARTPDAPAASCDGETLTYGTLAARVERLARHLRRLGCGPEGRVGVALERGLDLLVSLLGVLRAGAVYVPLDPQYPRERLAFLLEDARPTALLTDERLFDRLPLPAGLPVVFPAALLEAGGADTPEEIAGDRLAYVIYTSGSTGRPKGAMVVHGGMSNHLWAKVADLGLARESRVAQTASQCFDISVWQLLAPLVAGGSVHIATEPKVQDPERLLRFVAQEGITVLEVVPSLLVGLLDVLAAGLGAHDLSSLEWMITTGEACAPELARRWLAAAPHTQLLNAYGPTECSDDVTHHALARPDARPEETPALALPIGRPVANTRIHVLDASGRPAARGVAGELSVGGRGVGRGYLGLPERTARAFVPDPWGEPGARLYRTGDRARWLPDGTLEFLGRLDHQVKVRGFRIELGEIEVLLVAHPGVREAVVLARDQQLVAYVAGDFGDMAVEALRRALRDQLAERLPDYMVPAAFVTLAALPLTPNGKVDRKALPAPALPAARAVYSAPRTREEEILAGVWAQVLRRPRVGADDNFFELGGDSILSVQIVARARQAGLYLTVRQIFEHQTVAALARHAKPAEAPAGSPGLVAQSFDLDVYPLSPAQSGMLFHSLMAPDSGVYVNQVTCTLPADLDVRLFRQAWERLVERHGVLRTAFQWEGLDEPRQLVRKSVALPWRELDWRDLPAEETERRWEELRQGDREAPLPLSEAPLLRFCLVRLDGELQFLWTFHHLLLDGWSLPLLLRELAAVYAALSEEREPELPPARPFRDYIAWLAEQETAKAEPFWRRELAGFTAPTPLGLDRPGGGAPGYAEQKAELSVELTAGLQALAARHKLTLQTVTLGAWALLVSRYGGEEDVVFGSAVSGRPAALPGVETMVGMFINTLPVRARVEDAELLSSWLQRLQERQLERQDFEHSPLAQIQRWSEVPAGSPLFETLYVFENYPNAEEGRSGRLGIGDLRSYESTNYPLTLILTARDEISLHLMFELARVEKDAAQRLLHHFATLLAGMEEGPERRVGEVGLLTAAETLQLNAWNETDTPYSLDRPLHSWIEDQAGRSPEAVALAFENEALSYGELDRRANHLARRLQALGCRPESRVGVLLERSPELLVALFGILKAGAAYVPLDPDHPTDRLAYQDKDARLQRIVTRASLADRLLGAEDRFVFLEHGDLDGGAISVPVAPDHPAYVLYTSGSTGRPKGAVISHRAIVNRLLWMQEAFHLSAEDRVLQKTPTSFDVSVWELFWPLAAGACLVVARPGGHRDTDYLAQLIPQEGITVLHFVPSMLQLFLEESGAGECRTLRDVVCSGEALTPELARRFASRLGQARLHNLYGPTEAAVDVTSWIYEAADRESDRIPIGRPIANTRIHLLDRSFLPVPVGVPGELFIAGVNLARGYVERPDLTGERFLPDSQGSEPGGRVYRTGDLARRRGDGAIEFLGRLDHQVKIRGVRIEPGEIEAALLALPGVREAVVAAREERLVAYVVGDASIEALRQSLRERLPDAMMPATFVPLPALPLTANGKVDRKALPAPEQAGPRAGHVAPRTREEEILAAVWAHVLRLPQVGVDDNFFALGGDSILSVQIVSRARQAGLLFTMRQLFEHPTVARLALHATVTEAAGHAAGIAGIGQGPVAGEVPLTPIQRWFFTQGFAEPHHFNQALLLEPREPLSPAALRRAMAAIVEHHDALRLRFAPRFAPNTGGWRQENAPAEPVTPFHQVDLSALPAPRRRAAFDATAAALQAGFDLAAGPLTRLCLVNLDGETSRLLWVAHHLVVDGVSWRLLVEDLEEAYRQAARGLRITLPPKTTSFQEWARRLTGYAGSEALTRELDFWHETAWASVPPLPVDLPQEGDLEDGGLVGEEATVSFELGAEETTDLLKSLPAVYHNRIDEALLSALARALAGWTGSPRLRVDLEGHGREPLFDDIDVSRTVGWFTSLFPVLLEGGDADPGAALLRAKERLRAVPERGIGYGLLRWGNPEAARLLAAAPPAEILFNYLGQADVGPDIATAEGSLFRASTTGAGPNRSPRAHRPYRLEIVGIVAAGRLRITLTYGTRMVRLTTAERLAAAYADALRELIDQSRESEEVFTPSDFAKARLDAASFARVAALLTESD